MINILRNFISRSCIAGMMMVPVISSLSGQSHDYLFHPSFYDEYLMMQTLPGNKVRVFALSDQNNDWTNRQIIYADFSADSLHKNPLLVPISAPGELYNSLVYLPFMLRCGDGSTVIATNFFDCDYGGAEAVYKLNAAGEVAWVYNFRDHDIYTEVLHIAFVDANTFMVRTYEDPLFFDLEGNQLTIQASDPIFNISAQTSYGYLASLGDSLIILDQNFEPIHIYLLDGDIQSIDDVLLNEFQVRTATGYYELKEDLQVFSLPFSPEVYYPVWSSANYYWGYQQQENKVIQWDTFFAPIASFLLSPGVLPVAGIHLDSQILDLNAYDNELSQGLLSFRDSE